ncbi:Zinc finger CCCH domain-containing protein [Actinidia chinensis var. chinensis]|uniref:Zinc finger CCCH domain-containing protein n=1 Tax=Actinidia chinensis var. chinensis TaxID=1590841 RepID=A0A2R6QT98_ACTCC|nr:Zinc finger CCCH domain-containing protein [Actinidia chinensis var. chinensis]
MTLVLCSEACKIWLRCEMDLPESTKVVYNRIQKLEPENAYKILGYFLIQEHADRDMIRLAFSPDNVLHSLINKAKTDLGLSSPPAVSASISPPQANPFLSRPFSSPASLRATNPYWDPQVTVGNNLEYVSNDYGLENQLQFLSLEDQIETVNSVGLDGISNYYYPEPALGLRTSRRSPSLPEFPFKVCHYFVKGFCKHGNDCKYFHGRPMPESSFSQMSNPSSNKIRSEDHALSPGSLEKLEVEITELLKSRRGYPVSIASLPMLYYEKYGRSLQAEGYLTESQRHGKAGYSLTKLLARLKSIRLVDRPHGQHSVILAEDFPKYMEFNGERSDHGGIVAGSRQIYLTFPAESTFTEQDVSNYFNKFGPVQDVRIPCQQKRMFGFVTFAFAETVKQILTKGNPHFVCGARVLVKPYREKSRLVDRKHMEKIHHSMYYGSHFADPESELHSMPRVCDNSRLLNKHLVEEHDQELELGRMRFSDLNVAPKDMNHHHYFGYSMDELNVSKGHAEQSEFPSSGHFNYLLDVLNNGSITDDKVRCINTNYNDQDSSQGLDLPDSPFAAPLGSGISTVT